MVNIEEMVGKEPTTLTESLKTNNVLRVHEAVRQLIALLDNVTRLHKNVEACVCVVDVTIDVNEVTASLRLAYFTDLASNFLERSAVLKLVRNVKYLLDGLKAALDLSLGRSTTAVTNVHRALLKRLTHSGLSKKTGIVTDARKAVLSFTDAKLTDLTEMAVVGSLARDG